ncbi:hypothetical protein PHMEG_0003325 [Phytophthora megakarya]|uniref:L-dopachrome isomerase n=1 Tax=Phytophthora megakarya TaxID=4795 RepID=A0A225WWB5_9STRA|nr:hypothetical protein PHMEG_0003325 [Phytophthora megakarya]
MPYARITSNVAKDNIDTVAVGNAVAKTLNAAWGVPSHFMMVELNLGVPMIINHNDEPTAYVHARTIGNIDAEHNPNTIATLTKTVSEQLNVSPERVYVVLEDIKVGNWGANVESYNSTLSDVFEFIDTFDSSDGESTSADIASTDGDTNTASSPDSYNHDKATPKRSAVSTTSTKRSKKKRKPRQPGQEPQSTKFQREQRGQVLALRRQVLELTTRLTQLQRTRRDPTTEQIIGPQKTKSVVSVWENFAIIQCQERQRSEQTNRELKTMLVRQRKLERSICKLLGRKDALEGVDWLCQLQPTPESVTFTSAPQFNVDITDAVFAELEMAATELYPQTNSMFPPLEGQPTLSFDTKDMYADPLGTYIETRTVTPMACPLHEAGEILWNGTTKISKDPVPRCCINTLARSCTVELFDTVRIDGVNIVRRYVGSDQIVLVSAATWFLPAQGVHFQDNMWTVVSRSPVDPQNASIIQTFCQFGASKDVAVTASKEAFAAAQEYVRGPVGTKLRQFQAKQQRFLHEKAKSSATAH